MYLTNIFKIKFYSYNYFLFDTHILHGNIDMTVGG